VVLDHPGSDSLALEALVKGRLPLPGAEVIPDRLKDLDSVLKAKKLGEIDISAKKVVLMGHSLGALTAILTPEPKIAVRAPKE
jgi:predicted dienelactone hydrolase